jgi:hypothetical protein
MPSLRLLNLSELEAISSGSPNDIFPFIHLDALDLLYVNGSFHECVTLVKHLIVPPRCGLRLICYHAHLGFDQRQLWAIIEKKIDSWAKNTPYRRLHAVMSTGFVYIRNLLRDDGWESKEVDPVMSISVALSNFQETVPLFHSLFSLFEPTFFNTTCLHLRIYDDPVGAEAFTEQQVGPKFLTLSNPEKFGKMIELTLTPESPSCNTLISRSQTNKIRSLFYLC